MDVTTTSRSDLAAAPAVLYTSAAEPGVKRLDRTQRAAFAIGLAFKDAVHRGLGSRNFFRKSRLTPTCRCLDLRQEGRNIFVHTPNIYVNE